MSDVVRKFVLVAALPLVLAGCGVRGSLDAPEEAKAQGTATSPTAQDNGPKSSAQVKPHRDFLLDGLIR